MKLSQSLLVHDHFYCVKKKDDLLFNVSLVIYDETEIAEFLDTIKCTHMHP